jgi:hypothetical protein
VNALAAIQAPLSYGEAIDLGNRVWAKRILPIGEIEYQGRTLRFTRDYIEGLERAYRDQAYDQVAFQLADEANRHTNDPERFRGEIVDMQARDDGLWVYLQPTEAGDRVLRENPRLGVSARIVEHYNRSDGKTYPAAIQHVLGTLDPRIPQLGSWTPVDMAGDASIVIDLSQASWLGGDADDLTDQELEDLMDAMGDQGDGTELSDAELEELMAELDGMSDGELAQLEAEADGGTAAPDYTDAAQFATAFSNQYAATAQERQAADVYDLAHPLRRDEDVLARSLARLTSGTHAAQEFSNPGGAAIELAARSIAGTCGPVDAVSGLCMNMGHQPGCAGYAGIDGAREVGLAALYDDDDVISRMSHELAGTPWRRSQVFSPGTIELAREVGEMTPDLGAFRETPDWQDLLSGTTGSGDPYADLMYEMGLAELVPQHDGIPDVSGLRRDLGL